MTHPMRLVQIGGVAVLAFVVGGAANVAAADEAPPKVAEKPTEKEAARAEYKRATAAFGLGQYNEAARAYERAFRLVPDAAFLFNAAQAYRLGGRKPRALELYRNYVRVFGATGEAADDARRHVEALEAELAVDKPAAAPGAGGPTMPAAGSPLAPVAPAQAVLTPAAKSPAASSAAPTAPAPPNRTSAPLRADVVPPPVVAPPLPLPREPAGSLGGAADAESASLHPRPWLWAIAGGVALAIAGTAIALSTRGGGNAPTPTWQRIEVGGGR
jgi:tetratricopeptide (TPR) repeat protein